MGQGCDKDTELPAEQKEWQISKKHADLNFRRKACFDSDSTTMCEVNRAINNQRRTGWHQHVTAPKSLKSLLAKKAVLEVTFSPQSPADSNPVAWVSPVRPCLGTRDRGWDFRIDAVSTCLGPSPSLHYFLTTGVLVSRIHAPYSSGVSFSKLQMNHDSVLLKSLPMSSPLDYDKSQTSSMPTGLTDPPCALPRLIPQFCLAHFTSVTKALS